MADEAKQVIEQLKQANNVLVTVNSNPSIDGLAACLGLTLALNKLGKHATAVFSGEVPSTLEFLKPEETLEKNTDSLRDFIISLDKSKADKLRYKVEDNVVKIFITPYHTAITEKDFDYSQGDFNVDLVVALGVRSQQDLDQAITSYGRILHDATIATINTEVGSELGTLDLTNTSASSLSEQVSLLLSSLGDESFDSQIATALLTGVVSETERFSNEKTSPVTMSVSSTLMAAGANQQLVSTKLEVREEPQIEAGITDGESSLDTQADESDDKPDQTENPPMDEEMTQPEKPKDPGTLEIGHDDDEPNNDQADAQDNSTGSSPQILVDQDGKISNSSYSSDLKNEANKPENDRQKDKLKSGRMILQSPSKSQSNFTANSEPEKTGRANADIVLPAVEGSPPASQAEPEQTAQTASNGQPNQSTDVETEPGDLNQPSQPAPTDPGVIKPELETELSAAEPSKSADSPPITKFSKPPEPLNLNEALKKDALADSTAAANPKSVDSPMDYSPAESEPADKTSAQGNQKETLADIEAAVGNKQEEPNQAAQDIPDVKNNDIAISATGDLSSLSHNPGNANDAAENGNLDGARQAVEDAVAAVPAKQQPVEPIAALNAQPLETAEASADTPARPTPTAPSQPHFETMPTDSAADQPMAMPQPQFAPSANPQPTNQPPVDPNAPPPVPPPMMPSAFAPQNKQQ